MKDHSSVGRSRIDCVTARLLLFAALSIVVVGTTRAAAASGLQTRAFSGLSLVADTSTPLHAPVSQIIFAAGGSLRVCSGALIGSRFVLTAAHCLHSGPGGSFYSGFQVTPGRWRESGNSPFGQASAVSLAVWPGWLQQATTRSDLGILELDVPLGAGAGWFGLGSTQTQTFFTTTDFNNSGYPVGSTGDGYTMYERTGPIDAVGPEILTVNNVSVSGLSGAVLAHSMEDGIKVYGVLSGALSATATAFVALGPEKVAFLQEFIAARTSDELDLSVHSVRSVGALSAGSVLRDLQFRILNDSDEDFDGRLSADVLLSTDSAISIDDRLLGTLEFDLSLPAGQVEDVMTCTPVELPEDVVPGVYYVGITLNAEDEDSSNNTAASQFIFVTSAPDTTTTTLPDPSCMATTTLPTVTTTTVQLQQCGIAIPRALRQQAQDGAKPTATNAAVVLRAAVGALTCDYCVCDVNDDSNITASDALVVLRAAVGQAVILRCPDC